MNGFLMVMMIGLSFSSFGVALAQSPEETTSTKRNREEFKDNLVNESTEDDEIRKLQLERLKSATLGAEVLKARYQAGQLSISSFLEFQKIRGLAAFELVETKEDKIRWLEFVLENSRMVETYELALHSFRPSGGDAIAVAVARYGRLDAEIRLLKFKRDPVQLSKSLKRSSLSQNESEASIYDLEALQKMMKKIAEERTADDEIRKLQRQRLGSALNWVDALLERNRVGIKGASLLFEPIRNAGLAALELAESDEHRLRCLKYVFELSRRSEDRVLELQKTGASVGDSVAQATFWRIDAEINMLQFRRDQTIFRQPPTNCKRIPYGNQSRCENAQTHQVFLNNLAKERANDDEIRKLQRQRLETALLGVEALRERSEQGYISISFLVEAQRIAGLAALELAETREEQMQCLEFVLELSRKAEDRVLELQKVGVRGGEDDAVSQATYWRLDAEINLLQFKRESVTANSAQNGSTTVLNQRPGVQFCECLIQQTCSASNKSCAFSDGVPRIMASQTSDKHHRVNQELEAICPIRAHHYKASNQLGLGLSRPGQSRSLTIRRSNRSCQRSTP